MKKFRVDVIALNSNFKRIAQTTDRVRRRRLAVGVLILTSIVGAGGAARAEIPTGPGGISGTFGETAQRGAVDESTGAMTYSIPFELPRARGAAQPFLGLSYRSTSGAGEAGEDWSMGLPSIERAPLSNWPRYQDDGNLSHEDQYTFAGQSLTFICTVGANSACPSETGPMPGWASGFRHYRLRVDDNRGIRFFLSYDRETWVVQLRGGQIMEFGQPITRPDLTAAAVDRATEDHHKVFRWNLSRHYDLHGIAGTTSGGDIPALGGALNLIVYSWASDGFTHRRQYLEHIFYTPPVDGATSLSLFDFSYHVELSYEPAHPGHDRSPYPRIDRARPALLLRRVAVTAKPWSEAGNMPAERRIVRIYHLEYYPARSAVGFGQPVSASEAPTWYRRYLRQVQQEGSCGATEQGGRVGTTSCFKLPPLTFDYEAAELAAGSGGKSNSAALILTETNISQGSTGGLPWVGSTSILDVNRDGLPDIVQGWPQNMQLVDSPNENPRRPLWHLICNEADADKRVDRWFQIGNRLNTGRILFCPEMRDDETGELWEAEVVIASARRHEAIVNRGLVASGSIQLQHHCLDADALARGHVPLEPAPGFANPDPVNVALFSQFGSEVLGPWGDASLFWSGTTSNAWTGFGFESITSVNSVTPDFCPPSIRQPEYPALRWKKLERDTWAHAPDSVSANGGTYVDIDGDGYVDRLGAGAVSVLDGFQEGKLYPTLKVASGTSAVVHSGPALVPTTEQAFGPAGAETSAIPRNGRSWYADVNGDGLVDLVTADFGILRGGYLKVRPGSGRGHFGCYVSDTSCAPPTGTLPTWLGPYYEMSADVPFPSLWTDAGLTGEYPPGYLQDVTGDGLADLVHVNLYSSGSAADSPPPGVYLWVNRDGASFACANPADACRVATFPFPGPLNQQSPFRTKISFADVDGNGIDDLLILGLQKVWHLSFLKVAPVPSDARGRAPRPGLLTRIRSGDQSQLDIRYQTVQELDLQAQASTAGDSDNFRGPWDTHSPVVVPVVTRIDVRDVKTAAGAMMPEPFRIDRTTQLAYRNPRYDPWTRSLVGFERVRASHPNGATTQTWFWFSPCQQVNTTSCKRSSDAEPDAALVGVPVRVDRFASVGHRPLEWLSSEVFKYASSSIGSAGHDRASLRADLIRSDTHVYDTAVPVALNDARNPPTQLQQVPTQHGHKKQLSTLFAYDRSGNLTATVRCGTYIDSIQELPSPSCGPDSPEATVITEMSLPLEGRCGRDWACQPSGFKLLERAGSIQTTRREEHVTRNGASDIVRVQSHLRYETNLTGVVSPPDLNESRDPGRPRAGAPPSASSTAGLRTLAAIDYDPFGNPTRVRGPEGTSSAYRRPCTEYAMDRAFGQFITRVKTDLGAGNCLGPKLEKEFEFDRGAQRLTATIDRQRRTRATNVHDAFGRLFQIRAPHAEIPFSTQLQVEFFYRYETVAPHVLVRRWFYPFGVPTEASYAPSIEIFNGLGEPVLGLDRHPGMDVANAPPFNWVVRDWTERDNSGRVTARGRPFIYDDLTPPELIPAAVPAMSPSSAQLRVVYDAFGRSKQIFDDAILIAEHRYEPLQVDAQDAEQVKANGPHTGTFTRTLLDGHGRVWMTNHHRHNDIIVNRVQYLASGEPSIIKRCRSTAMPAEPDDLCNGVTASNLYQRVLQWDTLGRLIRNLEPNTSNGGLGAWVYAYDDAGRLVGTSDARGCGKNIYYDALGRVRAEDFSPCTDAQPAYTPPNIDTGLGTEAFYRYDGYEDQQTQPPSAIYQDSPEWAHGMLVGVSDRGAHTLFNYDARGRLRRTARRVTGPGTPAAALSDRYVSSAYVEHLHYDDSDRLARREPTLRTPDLTTNGSAEERFTYRADFLQQIESSWGALAKVRSRTADGSINWVEYGDAAATTLRIRRNAQNRLERFHLYRALVPGVWSTPPTSAYSLPDSDTTEPQLLDNHFAYDGVGNPLSIADLSTGGWPPGARQIKNEITYDSDYRVEDIVSTYSTPNETDHDELYPFQPEIAVRDHRPVPSDRAGLRPRHQEFFYDWMGNTAQTEDDQQMRFVRSLGKITNGGASAGPNQLVGADGIAAKYDAAGNMIELTVARVDCAAGRLPGHCSHRFVYDWDEIGQLMRARRWDYPAGPVASPNSMDSPEWDLTYAYSAGRRIRISSQEAEETRHTLDVLPTARVSRTRYDSALRDYVVQRGEEIRLLPGIGRVLTEPSAQMPSAHPDGLPVHVFMALPDHLGSTAFVIDKDSAEIVERTSYLPFGAVESDYRPARWASRREELKFTGKEDDIEVGLTYFGARYYQPQLGRWMSADPLTIHGVAAQPNPYAYVDNRVMSYVDPLGLDAEPMQEVCICHNGRGRAASHRLNVWHAEDRISGSDASRPRVLASPATVPHSSYSGAFNAQLARIGTNIGRAFANAGRDSLVGLLTHGSVPMKLAEQLGVFDSVKTPASDRNADYYAATIGLQVLTSLALGGEPALPAPAKSAPMRVGAAGGVDIQPATLFRTIQRGEKAMDIANQVNELAKVTELEYAVVRTTDGTRAIVYGGHHGIDFEDFPLKTLIGHSHPPGVMNALSDVDVALTRALGQRSSWLLENKVLRRFWVSDYW